MVEKGLRQLRVLEGLPSLEHDSVGQTLRLVVANMMALCDELRGPLKRWEQIPDLEGERQRHLKERVRAEVIVGRGQQREELRRRHVIGPEQVKGVAFDVVLRIRTALAGRQRTYEIGNGGVAAKVVL